MGILDPVFQDLAVFLTDVFVNTPAKFRRVRQSYGSTSGVEAAILEKEAEAKITPPAPFSIRNIDEKNVLSQDLQTYVPAKALSDAGFDPIPTTEVSIYVETRGRKYRVIRAEVFSAGDEDALFGLQLRP